MIIFKILIQTNPVKLKFVSLVFLPFADILCNTWPALLCIYCWFLWGPMPCPCPVCHPPPGNAPAHFIKVETAQSDFSSLSMPSLERFTKKIHTEPPPSLLLSLPYSSSCSSFPHLPPPSPYSCKRITDGRRHGSPLPGLAVGIGSSGVCPVPARCRGVGPGGKLIRIYWRKRGRRKTLIAAVLHLHTPSRNTGAIFLLRGFVTISWTTNASWHVRVSGIKEGGWLLCNAPLYPHRSHPAEPAGSTKAQQQPADSFIPQVPHPPSILCTGCCFSWKRLAYFPSPWTLLLWQVIRS